MSGNAAVFLDRDGTVNVEVNYLASAGGMVLYPGSAKAIRQINELQLPVILVTNQSGIGRGMFDVKILEEIHAKLRNLLYLEAKAKLDAIYYCPHLPEDGCNCRKPGLGMVESAKKELKIDPKISYYIGDRESDIAFGKNAGGKTILVLTGYGKDAKPKLKLVPDLIAEDLVEAVNWIKKDISVT